jgi:hypothetical protein
VNGSMLNLACGGCDAERQKLVAESYKPPNPGPYPQDKPPENYVRFTPVQVGGLLETGCF